MSIVINLKKTGKRFVFRLLTNNFPVFKSPSNKTLTVVTLLCHRDVYMYIYSLVSFFYFTGVSFKTLVINDGTLTAADISLIKKYFLVEVLSTSGIKKQLRPILTKNNNINQFLNSEYSAVTKWKLAFMLLKLHKKYIFLDSDLLFFSRPSEIVNWINKTTNYDLTMEYDDRPRYNDGDGDNNYLNLYNAYAESLNSTIYPNINTLFNIGIHCIHDSSLIEAGKLNKILKFFQKTGFDNQFPVDEMALSCLLTKKYSRSLPKEKYKIQLLGPRPERLPAVCKHYCWKAKAFFELDAIKLALNTRFFKL